MINLKERRLELGLTLEQVGKICGVGKSAVRKWENGIIRNMGRDKVILLSTALGVSPLEILTASDKMKDLSEPEQRLVKLFRNTDETTRVYVFEMLEAHQKKRCDSKKVSNARPRRGTRQITGTIRLKSEGGTIMTIRKIDADFSAAR